VTAFAAGLPGGSTNRLLASLEAATAAYPLDRKLLVCRDRGEGRELLTVLALRTGGWIGWEAATLRDLAGEMAFVALAERGVRILDDVEQPALVDAALEGILERGGTGAFGTSAEGIGFRRALAGSVEALRLARVEPDRLRHLPGGRERLHGLADVVQGYTRELERRKAGDLATALEEALASFGADLPLLQARIFVVPGLGTRGLTGRLLQKLLASGAVLLEADPVYGLDPPRHVLSGPGVKANGSSGREVPDPPARAGRRCPDEGQLELPMGDGAGATPAGGAGGAPVAAAPPTCLSWLHAPDRVPPTAEPLGIELFRASSPSSEVREVLRRIVSGGLPWDQVEIVATDPVTYGCAVDVLATRLEIPVTYTVGLPLERSRPGRAFRTYLQWLESGLHARPIWEALASGEISPPAVDGRRPSAAGVARQLRAFRVGWSRGRYQAALEWIAAAAADPGKLAGRDEEDLDEEELTRRLEKRTLELRSLEALLRELLASIPARLGEGSGAHRRSWRHTRLPVAALAEGALRFMAFFRPRGPAEADVLERVRERLGRVARVSTREAPFASALAELRQHLALRVPPPGTVGPLPWSSGGGLLHLTDLAHGGLSGRRCTFVVGLDAQRTSPGGEQDALLPDEDRLALRRSDSGPGNDDLPTSWELLEERRYGLASLLAGLRGDVTLSYSGWDAADGSIQSPAPLLVQTLRVRERDPRLGFEDLERVLGRPVSPVPERGLAADESDVWLGALSHGELLFAGEELVRSGFPMLSAGLASTSARAGDSLTAFHGRLTGILELDPRGRSQQMVSATGLETLARCPLAWFYRYGLKVRRPEDPEYDPGRWLDPLQRGSLLHKVFERFGREYAGRQRELEAPSARRTLLRIVEEELERFVRLVPPPSAAARAADAEEVRRSALVFLRMEIRSREGTWESFERVFGSDGVEPVPVGLADGRTLRVRGRIDRIDRLPEGGLRVIDYKTGMTRGYEKDAADPPFKGGRQIQAGLYPRVAEILTGEEVRRFEYRFPTERGENVTVEYEPGELQLALPIVERLLDLVAGGLFLATDDPEDCRYCDYRRVCRVAVLPGEQGPDSPPAKWSRAHGERLPEYAILRALRKGPFSEPEPR